jgi:hypothetical protein
MNSFDQCGPRLCFDESSASTVESDDTCPGIANSLRGLEIGCYINVTVRIVSFDNSDDWEIGHSPKGDEALDTFRPEAACSTPYDGGSDSSEGVYMIQRISQGSLTGNDEATPERGEDRSSGRDYALWHLNIFP